jgi:coenzyme F420-reducing hydrogenase gamma subunit
LVILNCEDQLLDLVSAIEIRDFIMAASGHDESRLDVAFVEGAVLSRRDEETLKQIRDRSDVLVALGTCAVWGGIAAMDRGLNREEMVKTVYGESGKKFDTNPATALHKVVKVDLNITGCPIEKDQFLSAVSDLLNGNPPLLPDYAVCAECKWKENNCLLIEKGEICCGPLTVAGCKARCPELNIACIGCRGPSTDANLKSALALFKEKGLALQDVANKFRTFAPVQIPD